MDLTKDVVKQLQADLGDLVTELALNYPGLSASRGSRATYDPTTGEINVTLHFRVEGEDQERKAFDAACILFGLKPEAYGFVINNRGAKYTLMGFDLKRRRYPVVVRDEAGTKRIFEQGILKQLPENLRRIVKDGVVQ